MPPLTIWGERLADSLDNQMRQKAVDFVMKVYDIVALVTTGEHRDLPADVSIHCDLQIQRVARTAGLATDGADDDAVMDAWAAIAEWVDEALGALISLLRIDSIV